MPNIDCCIDRDGCWFRYRAAAIIIEDGCVLMCRNPVDDYYYSVGGGVHIDESSEDCVRREVLEETGVAYEIDRLAVINECFFDGDGTLAGKRCHGVEFYYLMKPRGTQTLNSRSVTCGGLPETMHWLPIEDYGKEKAFPVFLSEWLRTMPQGVWHRISRENEIDK